eukprot:TRINITY_DN16705_c0_g1_i1.p1 TRINITY_DN16705_c0_g1~~TRINITY_DN16705_c0_g1_i1.p1  ORF type:complete len:227 (-),score=27.72 TRINITY_DN16705_c0_g1_i1:255-935(-)
MPAKQPSQPPLDFLVVIDIEATCEENVSDFPHELIELPAVLVDLRQRPCVVGPVGDENRTFHTYIRPDTAPSAFCQKLTGVDPKQLEAAPPLGEGLRLLDSWLNARGLLGETGASPRWAIATDGPWDVTKFVAPECARKGIQLPEYWQSWVNVRWWFAAHRRTSRVNVPRMLGQLGLQFEGRQHSGMDDAFNIARIAAAIADDGCCFTVNDGLSPELSVNWQLKRR